ncbi:NAD(P)H-hydrate dehydratase [Pseudomarimonas salicorniae]|uniref:Bifunctional NAD(P)H-hydrate repair enzyme n=1 Tax=Pseudomarimonas salicorniae TaxID=2933270 RepID=A0ABT0GLK4_9GAMM|nr:NAD(P)H-hydrate dehydratase [Lysobacter sp. CAU 1642]MCK7595436.1 NAD(P)H-hydrate dehydratase [Lysobacter sp. CAU 1642]
MKSGTPLYSSAAVRRLDAAAIAAGTPGLELMRRAGRVAFDALRQRWPQARRLLVLCGAGNNGGDGYVVASLARQAGLEVSVLALEGREPASEEARTVCAEWRRLGEVAPWRPGDALPRVDLIVDALFGTGLSRPLEGAAAALVEAVNDAGAPVLALDVPSGIDADRGHAPGPALRAALTVSFVGRKLGLYTGAGRAHAGDRHFDDLGASAGAGGEPPEACLLALDDCLGWLAPRRDDDHKGRFGHVLVVGGDHGMGGAVRLCAEAALRCGSGLVSVLTRPEHAVPLLGGRPELMVAPADGATWPEAAGRASVLAVGPGLGRGEWGRQQLEQALRRAAGQDLPCVLDADGLWHLEAGRELPGRLVLTPHPGEAARLLGTDTAGIQSDRPAAARELARRYRACVVLKGNGSLVADPKGRLGVVDAGNPGMASGGMGDVLTGVVAALLAQGLGPWQAAALGAVAHATAGDRAADGQPRGLIASDLFPALRRVLNP